jgi:hypothetical protein
LCSLSLQASSLILEANKLALVILCNFPLTKEHLISFVLDVLALFESSFHVDLIAELCLLDFFIPLNFSDILYIILLFNQSDILSLLLGLIDLLVCFVHLVLKHANSIPKQRAVTLYLTVDCLYLSIGKILSFQVNNIRSQV